MKNYLKILLLTFILITFLSCNFNVEKTENYTKHIIDFPYCKIDSINVENGKINAYLKDLKEAYVPLTYQQSIFWYSYQFSDLNVKYDTLNIFFEMPNRKNSNTFKSAFTFSSLEKRRKVLKNTLFEDFLKELFNLNLTSVKKYGKGMSMMYRLNQIFGKTIERNFKNEYKNNSSWFGYNSIEIFEIYFTECLNNKYGNGKKFIESLKTTKDYLDEDDKKKLIELIEMYKLKFNVYKKSA